MKPRKVLCLLLVLLAAIPGMAQTEIDLSTTVPTQQEEAAAPEVTELSSAPLLDAAPMTLSCASAILVEPESGQIIFEQNADSPRAVASITKVMTILLALEAIDQGRIDLGDEITISETSAGMGGSQVLLDVGEIQPFSVLLKSMIVGSANDAAVAIAEALYGSEELFVDKMNQRAQELNMTGTNFANCTGLPVEGQETTARDVAIMTMQMLEYPLYFEDAGIWMDEVDHGDGRITQLTNTNKLIRLYDGCDGGKTGSTNEAGYCVSATAKRGDMRLIAIVLGAEKGSVRFDIAAEMFDYGFANYRLYPVAQRGTKIRGELPVVGGDREGVPLALNGDLTLLIEKGDEQGITLASNLPESVEAPIEYLQQVGTVDIVVEGRVIAQIPVVALETVTSKGLGNAIRRIFENWLM